jgi:LmbE family N-acetylglucosaminyl deacetylase
MRIFNSRKIRIGRHVFLATLAIASIITAPRAQQPAPIAAPIDRVALYQALLDLTNPWTVMCIAAHPDDEDGTSLIVMRRKYGAHTVSLFSTFGEGGQNAIGPELYEELGAIRARETMAAAEIQGSEPHFLGLKDFGYSKSADEAFKFWGHEEALRRMVLEIRKLRPDVIITNHSVTNNDHGHHQATARLELEAFDAAADPKRFPEQLKDGVTVWQVQRLFVRARGNAGQNPDRQGGGEQIVTIDPNERDPIRNTVYAEEALRALQKHATQGPWPKTFAEFAARFRAFSGQSAAPGQLPLIRYRLTREAANVPPMDPQSSTFLSGLEPESGIRPWLDALKIDGRSPNEFWDQPNRVFARLLMLAAAQPAIPANDIRQQQKWAQLKSRLSDALAVVSGIKITLSSSVATPKSDHVVSISVTNAGTLKATITDLSGGENFTLAPGDDSTIRRHVQIPGDWTINLPLSQHLYNGFSSGLIVRESLKVKVEIHPSFVVSPSIELDVSPPVEIADITPSPAILTPATGSTDPTKRIKFTLKLINHQVTAFSGILLAASGITHERTDQVAVKLTAGESKTMTMMVQQPPPGNRAPANNISFILQSASANPPYETVPVVYADAHVSASLRVGYVRGFDYSLPNALAALGVESKELSVDEVKTADLSKFTSIIVDNRVYESQPELIAANQKLLDYANAGGTLIVFYHKSDEWNPDERRKRPQLAPYKLILGNERITDETAPVSFIEPEHPLLNFPNKMGQEDFANWIQERGLYYPKDWDAQFHALLQSNDPGEAPLKGGLLVADYGRGHYIYTSMVWYRELRGGVPGAYRMLANMISYGRAGK